METFRGLILYSDPSQRPRIYAEDQRRADSCRLPIVLRRAKCDSSPFGGERETKRGRTPTRPSYTASPSGDKVVVVGGDRFALNSETPTSEPGSSSALSPLIPKGLRRA